MYYPFLYETPRSPNTSARLVDIRAATVDFWQAASHSGSHFTGALPLPTLFSISQNPDKAQALAALYVCHST